MKTLLIDADLVAFRCAASVEPHGEEEVALLRADKLMRDLLVNTDSESYIAFLTGANNFRKKVNTEYKANRKDKEPPRWLQACRGFLVSDWNAIISDGCEADDLLGIAQTEDTRIASLDKDLKMIPGNHFNWLHNEYSYVSELEGIKHFYKQMLIGDKSDNIFGVMGLGPVKASKYIDHLTDEQEMLDIVYHLYLEDAGRFLMNAQCLWIMQQEGETWLHRKTDLILPSQLQQEVETMLGSMTFSTVGTSMEPTMTPLMTSGILVSGEPTECIQPQVVDLT
jgi:hypothetical protein